MILKTPVYNAGATKKQILSLPSSVGRGGDVPPLRRTTHLGISFIFARHCSSPYSKSREPDDSPSLGQASTRPELELLHLQRWH